MKIQFSDGPENRESLMIIIARTFLQVIWIDTISIEMFDSHECYW